MTIKFENVNAFTIEGIMKINILLDGNIIRTDAGKFPHEVDEVVDLEGLFLFPGFVDVHVHFREPGFCYKETISTGSMAAARGGYTAVCTMPNLNPVPSTLSQLQHESIRTRRTFRH